MRPAHPAHLDMRPGWDVSYLASKSKAGRFTPGQHPAWDALRKAKPKPKPSKRGGYRK
jgi:hypothetical protein